MKAPKKIYLYSYSTDGIYEVETKPLEGTVEYIRKDAFIEKAISWLKEQDEMTGVSFQEDFLERFQDYIKGE